MSFPMVDRASDLIEALKSNTENFELSNLNFPNKKSVKAVREFYKLKGDLLEFAKDPDMGLEMLGPPPQKPTQETLSKMTDFEKNQAVHEYAQMIKIYEAQKRALEMHVPYADYVMIENYLDQFVKTFHATPAVKAIRFKAFTKDVEHEEKGFLSGLFNRGRQQPS